MANAGTQNLPFISGLLLFAVGLSSGQVSQLSGSVIFTTDSSFATPLYSAVWEPSLKLIYIKYTDDRAPGMAKTVKITVTNTFPGPNNLPTTSVDTESLVMINRGDSGSWTVVVPLVDSPTPVPGNGSLEFYFKGVISASVSSHLNDGAGTPDGLTANNLLTTAYPNQQEVLTVTDPTNTKDSSINILSNSGLACVADQVFSNAGRDLLPVSLQCVNTGDELHETRLIQTHTNSINYCALFVMNQSAPVIGDGILNCSDGDSLKAMYIDPIYGTSAQVTHYLGRKLTPVLPTENVTPPSFAFNSKGDLHISMGDLTSAEYILKIHDFSGREIFSKKVPRTVSPAGLVIPHNLLPRSPVVLSVTHSEGVSLWTRSAFQPD